MAAASETDFLHKHSSCVCPITCEFMTDPVTTMGGHTYERAEITEWLKDHDTDPMTGKKLKSKELVPNIAIKKAIDEIMEAQQDLPDHLRYKPVSEPASGQSPQKRVNILVVGPSGVGKSSLLRRVRTDTFQDDTEATYGIDFEKQQYFTGNHFCEAKIWDTSGQRHLKDTVRTQYRSADCILFVFDVTRSETLRELEPYIEDARQQCVGPVKEMILIGNKTDDGEARQVETSQGLEFAEKFELHDYREVSAKTGANVKLSFRIALSHAAHRAPLNTELSRMRKNQFAGGKCCA